jgi:hypothetical protein
MLFPPLYAMPLGIDVLVLRDFLHKLRDGSCGRIAFFLVSAAFPNVYACLQASLHTPVHPSGAYAIKKPAPKYSFETS